MHFHGNSAWNALVFGKKGWVLLPPDKKFLSITPAADMVRILAEDDATRIKLNSPPRNIRCIQQAGDLMFIPMGWGHLTYNLATSIGLAKEFNFEAR